MFLGCFVLQVLFIARAWEWKGRRGGKMCRDKPKAAAGNGCCGNSGLRNDRTNTISAEVIYCWHYIAFIKFKTPVKAFTHFYIDSSALSMSSTRVFQGIRLSWAFTASFISLLLSWYLVSQALLLIFRTVCVPVTLIHSQSADDNNNQYLQVVVWLEHFVFILNYSDTLLQGVHSHPFLRASSSTSLPGFGFAFLQGGWIVF